MVNFTKTTKTTITGTLLGVNINENAKVMEWNNETNKNTDTGKKYTQYTLKIGGLDENGNYQTADIKTKDNLLNVNDAGSMKSFVGKSVSLEVGLFKKDFNEYLTLKDIKDLKLIKD